MFLFSGIVKKENLLFSGSFCWGMFVLVDKTTREITQYNAATALSAQNLMFTLREACPWDALIWSRRGFCRKTRTVTVKSPTEKASQSANYNCKIVVIKKIQIEHNKKLARWKLMSSH